MEHPRAQQRRWLVVGLLSTLVTGILGYVLAATLVKPEGVTEGPTRGSPLMLGWDLHQSGSEGFALGLPSLWQERRLPADAPNVRFLAVDVEPGLGDFTPVVAISKTDLPSSDAWWRGQDATRTPRFDLFAFSCGAQLDISDVKLPNTTAELSSIDGRFQKIITAVASATLTAPYQIDEIETILLQSTFDQIIHTFHFLR